MVSRVPSGALALLGFLLLAGVARAQESPITGFSSVRAAQQRAREAQFDAALKAGNLKSWMETLTAQPHHVGSPAGKKNAEFMAGLLRSWGYQTEIERFDVLFPTPKSRLLEMDGPKPFKAKLAEPPLKEDRTSGRLKEHLPPYNAYSVDGDVTAPVVYVNYGVPADYETLEQNGVDVRGKIVLARYGGSWRGIKPKVAAEHGAVGCLIYSDPADDGYGPGDVYPKGAFRPADGVQRGSVADMPLFPGDPLTPGRGATPGATRLALKDAPTLTKIPTLPISYADARPILEALSGPVAPTAWRGGLPLTYHLGPGTTKVHLKLAFDWKTVPAYDVIARLPGAESPDQWVIRGNHHDAWVFGASDPISGTVALLEEARAVAELAKSGWRPRRTILYALWDGEEPGLLGSTEWCEAHEDELRRKAVVYINSDNNGRGYLSVSGSHTWERAVNEVAGAVIDPEKKVPVLRRYQARRNAPLTDPMRIGALGSGSDYSPFLQHLGIASLDVRYGGEDSGGVYHSNYDSFDWYLRFGDPDFAYGIAEAQTAGRLVLRAADADVVPLEFGRFAETVDGYVKEVARLADTLRQETADRNRLIESRAPELASDPTLPFVAPKPQAPVPALRFEPLQTAAAHLKESARRYGERAADAPGLGLAARQELDAALRETERVLTRPEGLPRRDWYRHQVYAPGFYTGYGVKTLPGVREAIEQRDWAEATRQIDILAGVLEKCAAQIDRAAGLIQR